MSLKLRIPAVAAEPNPDVETRAVYVEEWIESLPYANPPSLIANLRTALHGLNRTPLRPAIRSSLLDLYLQPYHFLLDLAAQPPRGAHSILWRRQRAEAAELARLAGDHAAGYKRVLADLLDRQRLFGQAAELRHATQRAVLVLGYAAVNAWHAYLPVPRETWREMHALYRFADNRAFAERAGAGQGVELRLSVAACYKRSLLGALADPYRLPPGAIWKVHELLGERASHAHLQAPQAPAPRSAGMFVVDPHAGPRPAVTSGSTEGDGPGPGALVLDTRPLLTVLQSRLERERRAGTGDDSGRLLGPLLRAWGVPPRRHSARRSCDGEVSMVRGLSALHRVLGGDALTDPAEYGLPDGAPEGAIVVEVEEEALEEQEETAATAAPADIARERRDGEPWDLHNRSPGGLGVVRQLCPPTLPAVGDLAGVRFFDGDKNGGDENGGDDNWAVGVLRWLAAEREADCRAGVELLAASVQPAVVDLIRQSRAVACNALLVGKADAARGLCLLLPPRTLARGDEARVRTRARVLAGHADQLLDDTPLFQRIRFRADGPATD